MNWPHFPSFNKPGVIPAIIIFLSFLFLYSSTTPPHLTGYADSEELVTVAHLGGVAHPPGYALHTSILSLIMHFSPATPVKTANLSSAFFQSAALAIIFFALIILLSSHTKGSKRDVYLASAASVSIIGVSQIIWLTGTRIEVSAFSTFLVSLLVFSYAQWDYYVNNNGKHQPYLLSTLALFGIALSHMHTVILMLPGFVVALWLYRNQIRSYLNRWLLICSTAALVGGFFIPNSLLLLQNNNQADMSWYFPQTVTGWLGHITRRDYAGTFIEEGLERNAYWVGIPPHFLNTLAVYPEFLSRHFYPIIPVIVGMSLLYVILIKKFRLLPLVMWYLFTSPILFAYMGLPGKEIVPIERDLLTGVGERQYVIGYLLMSGVLAFGFINALSYARRVFRSTVTAQLLFSVSSLVVVFLIYQSSRISVLHANEPIIDAYNRSMLAAAVPNSVIICNADVTCFPLSYLSKVERVRPDVQILFKNAKNQVYFLQKNRHLYGLDYQENPDYVANLVAWNLHYRPVYLTNPTDYYIRYLGLNGDPLYLIPNDYMYQVSKELPSEISIFEYPISLSLLSKVPASTDVYTKGIIQYLGSIHTLSGTIYLNYGMNDEARKMLELGLSLSPGYETAITWLSLIPEYTKNDTYYGKRLPPVTQKMIQALANDGHEDRAYELARKNLYLNPFDHDLRLLMADLLYKAGYVEAAQREVNQIITLDPENQNANDRLLDFF
jgi:tetratricopeptide (TPR) repeat protein